VDSVAAKGQILKQEPAGGAEVKAGTTVTLTVSRGNQLEMPDLQGQTPTQAQNALQRLGWTGTLRVATAPTNDPDLVGLILRQDVPAGTGFARDQTITVTVGQSSSSSTTSPSDGDEGTFDSPFPSNPN
jgi:serine/threonine-protein kinase